MSAGWAAGSVRARMLARRRVGLAGARRIASAGSSAAAIAALTASVYGRAVEPAMPTTRAGRAIGSVCVWHLRVLAGWLPPHGGDAVRVFAGRFELANIADRFVVLSGEVSAERVGAGDPTSPSATAPPFELGALATAWPRLAAAPDLAAARAALAGSVWGDPGVVSWPDVESVLEARWARWLGDAVPDASRWAAGAAALVAARHVATRRPIPQVGLVELRRQLGRAWEGATGVADLPGRLSPVARWVFDGDADGGALWRAEARWWQRVDRDAAATLRSGRVGPAVVAAAAARLVVDARRAQAALEAAAWGGSGVEAFDAVA